MEAKHTKGPWQIQTSCSYRRIGNNEGDGNVCYPTNQRDGHPDLCFPNGGFNGPDARLIAAAPDLLEALRDLRVRFYNACRATGSDAWAADQACESADAAIAKAIGRAA